MSAEKKLPPLPLKGGCQCGKVRFELKGYPLFVLLCHCYECQHQSSSAFGEGAYSRAKDFAYTGDSEKYVKVYERTAISGRVVKGSFCTECGCRIYHAKPAHPEIYTLRAGCFDETKWLVPVAHIWVGSAQSWFPLPKASADMMVIDHQPGPDDMKVLEESYKRVMGI